MCFYPDCSIDVPLYLTSGTYKDLLFFLFPRLKPAAAGILHKSYRPLTYRIPGLNFISKMDFIG